MEGEGVGDLYGQGEKFGQEVLVKNLVFSYNELQPSLKCFPQWRRHVWT